MNFGSIIMLILQNFKYVVQFVQVIDKRVKLGITEKDIRLGIERLDKGFANVQTVKETAQAAKDINDSFRK